MKSLKISDEEWYNRKLDYDQTQSINIQPVMEPVRKKPSIRSSWVITLIVVLIFVFLIMWFFLYATSKEVWYAGDWDYAEKMKSDK